MASVADTALNHHHSLTPPKSAEHRFKVLASDPNPNRSTCQRSSFSTLCEVKRTCSAYFGIGNSHGRVGEEGGGHIEKSLTLTANFDHGDCMTLKVQQVLKCVNLTPLM